MKWEGHIGHTEISEIHIKFSCKSLKEMILGRPIGSWGESITAV